MKQRSIVLLGICLIIMVGMFSVSAVLYTQLRAVVGGNALISGKSGTIQGLDLYGPYVPISQYNHYLGKLSTNGLVVPLPSNASSMVNGATVGAIYRVFNNGSNYSYNVKISTNHSWFSNPQHPWYGYTYGFGPHEGAIVNELNFNLQPQASYQFHVWFSVDYNMCTPPGGYVHPTITIETI